MTETNRLSQIILAHWKEHCPRMVAELQAHNHLESALTEAEDRTADLLHELYTVQKMEYRDAWEMAMREWAFLPAENPLPPSGHLKLITKKDPPATSG